VIRFLRDWGPAILWAGLIVFLSSQSTLPVSLHGGRDKLAHFGAYAVLGFFLAHGQHRAGISLLWAIALGWFFGAVDEMYQGTVPGRTPAFADWVADALGVLAGVATYHLAWRRWSGRRTERRRQRPLPSMDEERGTV